MARGYAVVEGGQIDMKTGSDTPRAAKVNWLYVRMNIVPTMDWSDKRIADTFEVYAASLR